MDGRVRLTINALSQSFDYFGPYFLPDLEGAWMQGTYFSVTKNRVQSSQMIEIEHLLSI